MTTPNTVEEKKQIKAHDYPEIYKGLGYDLSKLGCVMLDVEIPSLWGLSQETGSELYYAKDKSRFWIDGLVGEKTAHCTLLYGLLETAKNYEMHIEQVLKSWTIKELEIESVGYFDSPYPDEPYFCIVGHVKITLELLEGHQRLELLPHINTFGGYKAHITLAYVVKDEAIRDRWINTMTSYVVGKKLKVIPKLNLGGN